MDPVNIYSGGGQKKYLSHQEIEKMKKNMKKVPVIELQAEIYHNKEKEEADSILDDIVKTKGMNDEEVIGDETVISSTRYQRLITRFKNLFTPSM